jgi:hypothetical protein
MLDPIHLFVNLLWQAIIGREIDRLDPVIKKRVVHVIKRGMAVSLVTVTACRQAPPGHTVTVYTSVDQPCAEPVLKDFDVVKEAGGPMRAVVREFTGIQAAGGLEISLRASKGVPLLCGVEVHEQ